MTSKSTISKRVVIYDCVRVCDLWMILRTCPDLELLCSILLSLKAPEHGVVDLVIQSLDFRLRQPKERPKNST